MAPPQKIRLGDLLIQQGLLTEEQLKLALEQQRATGRKLGRVFVDSGYVTEEGISQALARQLRVPFVDLKTFKPQAELLKLLNEAQARRYRALVIGEENGMLKVGLVDPTDLQVYDDITRIVRREIDIVVVTETQLLAVVDRVYRRTEEISGFAKELTAELGETAVDLGDMMGLTTDADDAPVVKLIHTVFDEAMRTKASDIHIEPEEKKLRIRFRIDGVLHQVYQIPMSVMTAMTSRIKLLGRMDVIEKRRPQDGRIKTRTPAGQEVELRLATLPTAFGEKLVMRIFDPEVLQRDLRSLGFSEDDQSRWHQMTSAPNGIVLVTGPTGSGKTSTLYTTLKVLATPEVNVCTIEDPIEMVESAFNQMQVQHNIDIGFADGVRALMRQDPDIIMIGEIRDLETAEMAIQAALTGHLVLSTLHTNDAPSAITRLLDLGVPAYLINSTVLGVMAQRLVRTLCPHCKKPAPITEDQRQSWRALVAPWKSNEPAQIYQPVGCLECRMTGYSGRVGIYEILVNSAEVRKQIRPQIEIARVREQAIREGMRPLRISGALKVAQGLTSLEEIIKVAPPSDEA